jgi:hypothetical protein
VGLIRPGPPEDLVLLLKERGHVATFIETGTYLGDTALWAAKHFEKVITVEMSQHFHSQASDRGREAPNIRFVLGDSGKKLESLAQQSSIVWLDAHWSAGATAGQHCECPLLAELQALRGAASDVFVLIDDARLFLSPPPLPHLIAQWPNITTVLSALAMLSDSDRYTVVFDDVIVSVPAAHGHAVAEFCQKQNTARWHRSSLQRKLRSYLRALVPS